MNAEKTRICDETFAVMAKACRHGRTYDPVLYGTAMTNCPPDQRSWCVHVHNTGGTKCGPEHCPLFRDR